MLKQTKRGFTITELVIVIVVIAILAAVLIPTFASLIKKANQSADIQAVRQMNTILKADEAENGKPEGVDQAVEILIANGYSDFDTYLENSFLGWVEEENMVALVEIVEEVETVIFPKECVDKTFVRINPAAKTLEDVLAALQNGNGATVFLGEDVEAATATDFHFTNGGQYGLNLGGKTIYTNVPNTAKGYKDGVLVDGTTKTTISDGVIEGGADVEQVVAVYDTAELEIKDAVISGGSQIAVLAEAGGTAKISDTKVMGASGTNPLQAYGGTLVLDNVTAVQSGEHEEAWYNSVIQVANEIANVNGTWQATGKKAVVTVNSGNYSGARAVQVNSPGGYVTINGGTFTGTQYAIYSGLAQGYKDQGCECEITINGGTFNGALVFGNLDKVTINGGTFTVDPTQWVGTGHTVTNNGNGTWTVK